MEDFQLLIDDLNVMTPLGQTFRELLLDVIEKQILTSPTDLIGLGDEVNDAWHILVGYVVAEELDSDGKWQVIKIGGPRTINTCLPAFFEGDKSHFRLRTVGEVRLHHISKKGFLSLAHCPETHKLVNHIMLEEIAATEKRLKLLNHPEPKRVAEFLAITGFYDLPAFYAASYLNMTEDNYLQHKLAIFSKDPEWGVHLTAGPQLRKHEQTKSLMHRVRQYILENYTNPEIGTTEEIAERFSTTRQTLHREFKKSFGMTLHKMVESERMQKGKFLLKAQKLSVTEVSKILGYSDIYSFSNAFKQFYGKSPKKFLDDL